MWVICSFTCREPCVCLTLCASQSMVKCLNCALVLQTGASLPGTIKTTVMHAVLEIKPSYHENTVLLAEILVLLYPIANVIRLDISGISLSLLLSWSTIACFVFVDRLGRNCVYLDESFLCGESSEGVEKPCVSGCSGMNFYLWLGSFRLMCLLLLKIKLFGFYLSLRFD